MEDVYDKTPVPESADSYEAPTVVDLGTLVDLTHGGPTPVNDTGSIGVGPDLGIGPSV